MASNRLTFGSTVIGSTATFTRPSGTLDTDELVFFTNVRQGDGSVVTGPAGSTVVMNTWDGSFAVGWTHRVRAGTATSYTLTAAITNSVFHFVGVFADAGDAVAVGTGTVGTLTAPSMDATANDIMLVTIYNQTYLTHGPPPGMTEMTDDTTGTKGTGNTSGATAIQVISAAGATGIRTFTASGTAFQTPSTVRIPHASGAPPVTPIFKPWKGLTTRPWKGLQPETWHGL